MCLIIFSWQPPSLAPNPSPTASLILAANRDEFYARPTQAAHWWQMPHHGSVLAGRDEVAGGTWLGINRRGRLAALTNYRDPSLFDARRESRGLLVSNFLRDDNHQSAEDYLHHCANEAYRYNPYNLLVFDGTSLMVYSSVLNRIEAVAPGFHTLSNAHLNSPWPKAQLMHQHWQMMSEEKRTHVDALFSMLSNQTVADDETLPQTGIPYAREKALSAPFIVTEDYGTRSQCAVVIDNEAPFIQFAERQTLPKGVTHSVQRFKFMVEYWDDSTHSLPSLTVSH